MDVPRNDERRVEPARHHQKLASGEYELWRLLSTVLGEIFWAVEQRRSKLADLEELESMQ